MEKENPLTYRQSGGSVHLKNWQLSPTDVASHASVRRKQVWDAVTELITHTYTVQTDAEIQPRSESYFESLIIKRGDDICDERTNPESLHLEVGK